ncbi:MAG: hypothetical protein K2X94_04825 [Amoebophilaceae bacterium]|nr:hypothetical protein [Amoebophilaceae bacterium]
MIPRKPILSYPILMFILCYTIGSTCHSGDDAHTPKKENPCIATVLPTELRATPALELPLEPAAQPNESCIDHKLLIQKIKSISENLNHLTINGIVCTEGNFEQLITTLSASLTPYELDRLLENLEPLIPLAHQRLMKVAIKNDCRWHEEAIAHEMKITPTSQLTYTEECKGGSVEEVVLQHKVMQKKSEPITVVHRSLIHNVTHQGKTVRGTNGPLFDLQSTLTLSNLADTAQIDRSSTTVHEIDEAFNPYWFLSEQPSSKPLVLEAYGIDTAIIDQLKKLDQLDKISYDLPTLKKQLAMLKCASLITYLYKVAKKKGVSFIKGSFSIEDQGEKLYNTLCRLGKQATNKYFYDRNPKERRSSHYTHSEKQCGLDIVVEENSDPINLLPNNRHHILLGSVDKGNKKATFIKCETYGLASNFDYISHANQYVKYKFKGRKHSNARRETDLPPDLAIAWQNYAKNFKIKEKIIKKAPVHDIVKLLEAHKDHSTHHTFQSLQSILDKYEKKRGPLYLMTGNEFIIPQETTYIILERLDKKGVLTFPE